MFKSIKNVTIHKTDIIFVIIGLFCLVPIISSPVALLIGFSLSTLGYTPKNINLNTLTKTLLAYSIVGLGFGINLNEAISATKDGFGIIVVSIFSTLILG